MNRPTKSNADQFLDALETDAELRARLRDAQNGFGGEIAKLARSAGFDCTADELRAAVKRKHPTSGDDSTWDPDGPDPQLCVIICLSEGPAHS